MSIRHCVAAVLLTGLHAAAAAAQTASGLAGLLPELVLREIMLPAPATPGVFSHAAHFSSLVSNDPENPAVGIVNGFNRAVVVQLSTFPLGTSAGGFTYTFDPAIGTFRRSSRSFGPAFAERAFTIGRGRASAGVTYQHTSYGDFEGRDLDSGAIRFYLRHEECCSVGGPPTPPTFGVIARPDGSRLTPFFEGDIIEASLSLRASTDTVAFVATYGLMDRWDVGIAVPIVRVDLEATVRAAIKRLSTSSNPLIHTFEAGNAAATENTYTRSGSASGLGDILLRTKVRLGAEGPVATALAADVRLPTGDRDNLLGAGAAARFYFITSSSGDRFGWHGNLGYTVAGARLGGPPSFRALAGASAVPDEVGYAGGIEVVPDSRVTLVADLLGRLLRRTGRLRPALKTFEFALPARPPQPPETASFEEFEIRSGNLNILLGAAGLKVNPAGNLLLSAHVLFPLSRAGLRVRLATVLGVDYAF
ncbi:MAG TPA: transporter [Vicinamibacterales bacterium]|nr:transporter [Vicinamibacterales bacterium]